MITSAFFGVIFYYENGLFYPVYVSDKEFEDCMDSLLITDDNRSHYVYIKDFNRFICQKTRHKNKKHFLLILFGVL